MWRNGHKSPQKSKNTTCNRHIEGCKSQHGHQRIFASPQIIYFIGRLSVPSGQHAGDPIILLPWQRRFIAGLCKPGVTQAVLSVGRGNGKTVLAAMLLAYVFLHSRPRHESVCVAPSLSQAEVVFFQMLELLRSVGHCIDNGDEYKLHKYTGRALVEHRPSGRMVRCMSGGNPGYLHGRIDMGFVVIDEPAQFRASVAEEVYTTLLTT